MKAASEAYGLDIDCAFNAPEYMRAAGLDVIDT